MPSKHIDEKTWRKIEKETVRAVIASQTAFKETDILRILVLKGLEKITDDDYKKESLKKRS
jgi:hypothetical protein